MRLSELIDTPEELAQCGDGDIRIDGNSIMIEFDTGGFVVIDTDI